MPTRTPWKRLRLLIPLLGFALWCVAGCSTPPPPFKYNLVNVPTSADRGGRGVSVDANPGDPNDAIAASEQGGLFRTKNLGVSWTHIDSFPSAPVSLVRFLPLSAYTSVGAVPGQFILVTAKADTHVSPAAGSAGIWLSIDGAVNWHHVALSDPACVGNAAYGIGFSGTTIAVGMDCGVVISTNMGKTWNRVYDKSVAFEVIPMGGSRLIICGNEGLVQLTYSSPASEIVITQPIVCDQFNMQTFAVVEGTAVNQPDLLVALEQIPNTTGQRYDFRYYQGTGGTWQPGISLGVYLATDYTPLTSRPYFVKMHHEGAATIDLYVYGSSRFARTQCSLGGANWSCPTSFATWVPLPTGSNPNWLPMIDDASDLVFSPAGNCPLYMISDHGITTADLPSLTTCTQGLSWTLSGTVSTGYDALQMYDIAGQMNEGNTRDISPTTIFASTQDNGVYNSSDGGVTLTHDGSTPEGYGLQAPLFGSANAELSGATYDTCGNQSGPECTLGKDWVSGGVFSVHGWGAGLPNAGGDSIVAPTLIRPGQYLAWSDTNSLTDNLYMSLNDGQTWTPVSALSPAHWKYPHDMQVSLPQAKRPVVYAALQEFEAPNAGRLFVFDGVEDPFSGAPQYAVGAPLSAISLGLSWIGTRGAAFTYHYVYAADPVDSCHLIATDLTTNKMVVSHTGGLTWTPDNTLTQLVTQNGALNFSSNLPWVGPQSEATKIAIDPLNPAFLAVGTEQAGIIISNDGGQSWKVVPGSDQLRAITSFFFDDLHHQVYAGTYSRGLWRFDWTNYALSGRQDLYSAGTPTVTGGSGGNCSPTTTQPTPTTTTVGGDVTTPSPRPTTVGQPTAIPTATVAVQPTRTPTGQCSPLVGGSGGMTTTAPYLDVETATGIGGASAGADVQWDPASHMMQPIGGATLADRGALGAAGYASVTCAQLKGARYGAASASVADGEIFFVKTAAGHYAKVLVALTPGSPYPTVTWQSYRIS